MEYKLSQLVVTSFNRDGGMASLLGYPIGSAPGRGSRVEV